MKWSFASVAVIVAGIIGIVIILLFQQITTNNESDYYLLKEITQAAMIESIDFEEYQKEGGKLKISREKFVENFTRRFAESTSLTGTGYTINFYDIMEDYPKVSVLINTGLGQYKIFEDTSNYEVVNRLDAILEYVSADSSLSSQTITINPYKKKTKVIANDYYYSLTKNNENGTFEDTRALAIPEELRQTNIKNVKISKITKLNPSLNQKTLDEALLWRNVNYVYTNADKSKNLDVVPYAASIKDFTTPSEVTIAAVNYDDDCKVSYVGDTTNTGTKCKENNVKYKYWIKLKGTRKDNKKFTMTKYQVTWSYEEYAYK